ncbi:phage major capsid protein, partial [Evtepia gabavorous]|uniref:phage major capsid protein n=1 Tax=Evtepia gabavorous TaxID=2211183 RepID=UPI003A917AAC
MRSNDLINSKKTEIQADMQKALQNNDAEGAAAAFDQMLGYVADTVRQDYEDLRNEQDSRTLAARGVRQLTSEETKYYQALGEAMRAKNPQQALANLDVVMPETVIDSVFEDLETNHPLLSRIDFMPSGGAVRMIMNTNGYQEAAWGELCDEVVKELTSGFKEVNTVLFKLSALLPVCKAMLELGPQWLDSYVRRILLEALANGLEAALVTGDGNEKPVGMNRQVGDGVAVTGNVYPKKPTISVTDFSPA